VRQAKAAIEMGARIAVRSLPWRLKVLLPRDAGPSTEYLGRCLEDIGAEGSTIVECVFTKKMEPAVLARKLLEGRMEAGCAAAERPEES